MPERIKTPSGSFSSTLELLGDIFLSNVAIQDVPYNALPTAAQSSLIDAVKKADALKNAGISIDDLSIRKMVLSLGAPTPDETVFAAHADSPDDERPGDIFFFVRNDVVISSLIEVGDAG